MFIIVSDGLQSLPLNPSEKWVLANIANWGAKGCCYSNSYFEDLLGIKRRQVQNILSSLTDKGYIRETLTTIYDPKIYRKVTVRQLTVTDKYLYICPQYTQQKINA